MPRFSRVAEDAARRGLVYDPRTRGARAPGPGGPVFSRRQFDKMRDQPAPFEARGDAHTAAVFLRTQRRRDHQYEADRVLADRNLLAAIAVLRWDAEQPGDRRTQDEARRFAWALRRLHGRRTVDWTRYVSRRG